MPLSQYLSFENLFDVHENEPSGEKTVSYGMEWKTRFDTEAKSNSEMPIRQCEFVLSKHFLSGILQPFGLEIQLVVVIPDFMCYVFIVTIAGSP